MGVKKKKPNKPAMVHRSSYTTAPLKPGDCPQYKHYPAKGHSKRYRCGVDERRYLCEGCTVDRIWDVVREQSDGLREISGT